MMPSTPPTKTMNILPLGPKRAGKLSAMATAVRIESIEKAMSVMVTEVTVPQNPRSHRCLSSPGTLPAGSDESAPCCDLARK